MKPNSRLCSILAGAVLLDLVSTAFGHGHEGIGTTETDSMMNHAEMARPTISNLEVIGLPSYFRHHPYSGLMLAHIVVMSITWIFVLPLGQEPLCTTP
jgi:hypothetical protein